MKENKIQESKMKTKFNKDYYQDSIINKEGVVEVLPGFKRMWHLSIEKDYFVENQGAVLDMAIEDLEKEVERLKEIAKREKNKKKKKDSKDSEIIDSWDSISK